MMANADQRQTVDCVIIRDESVTLAESTARVEYISPENSLVTEDTTVANLYATGSPIVVAAGALLRDNQSGNLLAQLKLRSISPKTIIGVRVQLQLLDTFGSLLGAPITQEFANEIGADCYTLDAASAAQEAVRLINELKA
jgi:hypothetical protein